MRLNVLAVMRLTHAAASAMAGRGRGGILNVSSLAGFQPGPKNATYGATKAFVTSFTEAVHEEMKGTGVSVGVLCPGFTRTEFQERASVPASGVPGIMWQNAAEVVTRGPRRGGQEQGGHHPRHPQQVARQLLERDPARDHASPRRRRPQTHRGVVTRYRSTRTLVDEYLAHKQLGDGAVAGDGVELALRVLAERRE